MKTKRGPAINKKFIERETLKSIRNKNKSDDLPVFEDLMKEDRFKGLAENKDFEVDESNEDFLVRNAASRKAIRKKK